MPSKSTVSGILQDARLTPIAGGKIVATLVGSDIFDGGTQIVGQKAETTTGTGGRWSMPLIVNGEGQNASTSWTVEIFNEFAMPVGKISDLFVATANPITLSDLEKTSAANKVAATEALRSRLIVVAAFEEYEVLPASQKRANDVVLVTEV